MTKPQFFFTVTLPSPRVMGNTERYLALFRGCLNSLMNQSAETFQVLVGCHEIPETDHNDDPRLTYLPVPYPVPASNDEKFADKLKKRKTMAAEIRRRGGGYMAHVDYDDRMHSGVCGHVLKDGDPNGYIVTKGYEYDVDRDKIVAYPIIPVLQPSFDRISGTSSIIHFSPEELPSSLEDETPCRFDTYQRDHHLWTERAKTEGRPFKALPFRAAIWMINSGLNLSVLTGHMGPRVSLPHIIARWRKPTAEERAAFCL